MKPIGSFRKLIQKFEKIDLLILDEWLLTELSEEHVLHVLEIIVARLKRASGYVQVTLPPLPCFLPVFANEFTTCCQQFYQWGSHQESAGIQR